MPLIVVTTDVSCNSVKVDVNLVGFFAAEAI